MIIGQVDTASVPRTRLLVACALTASVLVAVGPGSVPAEASHAPCDQIEQATFVYRQGSGQNPYGSMSTMWSYDRDVVYCAAANTTFVRLGLSYADYFEIGLYHKTTSATPVGFTSWAINGNPYLALETTTFPNNDWYSFALIPLREHELMEGRVRLLWDTDLLDIDGDYTNPVDRSRPN